jgi:acyl-CoA reductase-like NAD-dependent aldehyde dehydrogenase
MPQISLKTSLPPRCSWRPLVGHVKSMRLGTGTVCREEIFGPVCHIEPFDTEEE